MRRIRVGVAALGLSLALGQNAPAADLPAQPVYKAPVAVLMHNWTGFYVGGHLGGAWSRVRWGDIVDNNAFAFTGS